MDKVVIFGSGDFAHVVHASLVHDSPYEVVGFTVHEQYIRKSELLGLKVIPFERIQEVFPPDRFAIFVAIGYREVNRLRARVFAECKRAGYRPATFISPRAALTGSVSVGENCFVGDYAVIRTLTEIGDDVIIGGLSYIGQRTRIGDHCFISQSSSLASNNEIEPYAFIGANATIRDGVRVGRGCVIGAGAVALHDTEENRVYKAATAHALDIEPADLDKI